MRVGQWGSQRAHSSALPLAASVASRYALGADGVGAARPGARGSRVTASRYALGAEGGGRCAPGRLPVSPRKCARCLLGGSGDTRGPRRAVAHQARNDGVDLERANATWSTSSFTSYHGQLLSLAVQWGVAIEIERAIKTSARFC